MPELILVKHSMPAIVEDAPASTWCLSAEGRARCHRLAEFLASHDPHLIFTSHEPKASETGQIVASLLNLPCEAVDHLHEHDRTGEPYERREVFEEKVRAFFERPDELVFGRETAAEAQARFDGAVAELLGRFPEDNLVVVAHGTVITLFTAFIFGLEPFTLWQRLGLPSAVIIGLPDVELLDIADSF